MLIRPRRNRKNAAMRALLAETRLCADDFILPIFVQEGIARKDDILSMPNVYRYSIDKLLEFLEEVIAAGINGIALFPVVDAGDKSDDGGEACNPDALISRAIIAVKNKYADLLVIADVALDPYTTHGHDGIIENGDVQNDKTVSVVTFSYN